MPNLMNVLYPPLIDTFMPAFLYTDPIKITFSISPYMNFFSDIKKIHISIIDQITNEKVFKTTSIPNSSGIKNETNFALIDGILIMPIDNQNYISTDSMAFKYEISIPSTNDFLKNNGFQTDRYYKIQIRFDKNAVDLTKIKTDYLTTPTRMANFSEWSSISLVKAISIPSLVFPQFDNSNISDDLITEDNPLKIQPGMIPFFGTLNFSDGSETETLQSFKVDIFSYENDENIFSSETIYTKDNVNPNEINWSPDTEGLIESKKTYYAIFTCTTKNQYVFSSNRLYFRLSDFSSTFSLKLKSKFDGQINNNQLLAKEDGVVKFNLSTGKDIDQEIPKGFLYIKRASSLDNFKNWELVSCTLEPQESGIINRTFSDFTVGSLIKYKYSYQYRLLEGDYFLQKEDIKENQNNLTIYPSFHDILISRAGKQLAIRYNPQITSFSAVVNRQKVNTLGGKYPKFVENANMNYKQFSISGLLTAEADYNRKFLSDLQYQDIIDDYDAIMNGKYSIRNDTIADQENTYQNQINSADAFYDIKRNVKKYTKHDIYPTDNWLWERIFREEVLKWLNDGKPKLFRSMTEGNLAVILSDITLAPNAQLGRRIYNISMTVTEIEDGYSLSTLDSLGIIDITNEYDDYKLRKKTFPETQDIKENVCQIYQASTEGYSERSLIQKNNDYNTLHTYYNDLLCQGLKDLNSMSEEETFTVPENSYRIKNLKVHFESDPIAYYVDNGNLKKANEETDSDQNILIGYKLGLKFENETNSKIIFINDKGYYQVPSEVLVTEITLYDESQATFDFILSYKRQKSQYSTLVRKEESSPNFIGQIYGTWFPEESLYNKIKEKHKYTIKKTGNLITKENTVRVYESLERINAINFEVEPYTIVHIIFEEDNKDTLTPQDYLIGRTGVYNLMTDFPIKEIYFKGKRMFKTELSNQSFLDEWEFVIDNENYYSIKDIKKPKYNTVYKINNRKYKIYYIDGKWYDFSFSDENNIIGNIQTPISGMINYRGTLSRSEYI